MTAIVVMAALAAGLIAWFVFEKSRRRTHPVSGGIKRDVTLPHEQAFELYGNAFSHCSRKTRLVMAELGIPYRHRHVDLIETGSYGTLTPEFLRVNPAGLIPVLVHEGHPVHESDDILNYAVAAAAPDAPKLIPDDPAMRAEMEQWIQFCSLSSTDPTGRKAQSLGACIPGLTLPLFATMMRYVPVYRLATGFLFHHDKMRPVFFSMAKMLGVRRVTSLPAIAAMIAESRAAMGAHLQKVEEALGKRGPWLLGEQFTLADITLGCALLRLDETGWLKRFAARGDLTNTLAYYDRVRQRPSWRAAIDQVRHPIVDKGSADLSTVSPLF